MGPGNLHCGLRDAKEEFCEPTLGVEPASGLPEHRTRGWRNIQPCRKRRPPFTQGFEVSEPGRPPPFEEEIASAQQARIVPAIDFQPRRRTVGPWRSEERRVGKECR